MCIQDHLPVCVEQGIGQCRSLNSLVIEVCHPKLTSYILRGVIQNESLRHLKLACDFTGMICAVSIFGHACSILCGDS